MSDKTLARRTAVKLYFNGADISKDLSKYLLSLSFTDKEEDETDDISISLDDREGKWIKDWLNTSKTKSEKRAFKGAEIHAKVIQKNPCTDGKDKVLDCGVFEIDSVSYTGPPGKLEIKATSIPYKAKLRQTKHNREWEKTTLKNIAQKIAGRSGMKLMYLSGSNPIYKRREQRNMTDIAFLRRLCKRAGISLKVTSKKIVLFDAADFEKKAEVKRIKAGRGNILSYSFSTKTADTAYSSCHVVYTDPDTKKKIEATYKPENANSDGQVLEITQKVSGVAEAKELARKMLREKNKRETTAEFTLAGDVDYVAGITVRVYGFGEFNGKYIVEQASHSITGGYKVQIKLRSCLEGY